MLAEIMKKCLYECPLEAGETTYKLEDMASNALSNIKASKAFDRDWVMHASMYNMIRGVAWPKGEYHVTEDMAMLFSKTDTLKAGIYQIFEKENDYLFFYPPLKKLLPDWLKFPKSALKSIMIHVALITDSEGALVQEKPSNIMGALYGITDGSIITGQWHPFFLNMGWLEERNNDIGNMNKDIIDLVANSILYVQSHPDWIERVESSEKHPTKKMGKRKRGLLEIENQYRVIHKIGIPKQITKSIKASDFDEYGHPLKQYTLNKRFMVRGHWRNQVCGKKNQNRKYIFIAPFWKGPEDAPLVDHIYKIN